MRSTPLRPMHLPLGVLALAVLGGPTDASAVDLTDYLEAWTVRVSGAGGTDGVDAGHAVSISALDHVLVAGQLDGATAHQAFVAEYDVAGTEVWRDTSAGGPADAWFDVVYEPTSDAFVLCGAIGDPVPFYTVTVRDPGSPPVERWVYDVQYGGPTSDVQECRAAAWYQGNVVSSGWADGGTENGEWLTYHSDGAAGFAAGPPLVMDAASFASVPDRANGLAVSSVDGSFVVVGERGAAGIDGGLQNDTDFHVVAFDPTKTQSWQATLQNPAYLDDIARDVVIDPGTGSSYVVGSQNHGSDNFTNADNDWYVVKWDPAGDGSGGGLAQWAISWESATGADEIATSVVLDDVGDVLVAGTMVDPVSGLDVIRVNKFAAYDGTWVQGWTAPAGTGDAHVSSIAFRNGLIAVAGWEDTGAGPDLRLTLLDTDGDGDGVADAADACPTDADKWVDPGVCGCGVLDNDTDGDTVLNCDDACPSDPNKSLDGGVCGCDESEDDDDSDGRPNCDDDCPTDPLKMDGVGECGCGSPETDSDGDGVLGCHDACINTPPGEEVDEFGCPVETTTDDTDGPGDTDATTDGGDKGGCGCSGSAPAPFVAALLALGLLRRRR